MSIARIQNGVIAEYPISFEELRLRFPNTIFFMPLARDQLPDNYTLVESTIPPEPDQGHVAIEGAPLSIEGIWRQTWQQQALPVDEVIAMYERAVDAHLDAAAQARGYASIVTAVTYAGDSHPRFGAEGAAFRAWRSSVYDACYAVLNAVQEGQRAQPTIQELINELPALELPA